MEPSRYDEMRTQCIQWHGEHPMVWKLFKQFAFDRINRGFTHYSVKAIFERIRWETDQAQVDTEQQFKINNNYPPFYARAFMKRFPEHDGFFRTRQQLSKHEPPSGKPELRPQDYI